jgi:hypothetical protein
VYGNLPVAEGGEFSLIVVDEDDVMSEVGEACPCDQAYVSRTHYGNLHVQTPVMEIDL